MNTYTTVIKHEHKQGKSLVFYVIMTPFPFYKNMLIFQADLVLIKMGLCWPNFSLVFLIHLFLYAGVYCIYQTGLVALLTAVEHFRQRLLHIKNVREGLGKLVRLQSKQDDSQSKSAVLLTITSLKMKPVPGSR